MKRTLLALAAVTALSAPSVYADTTSAANTSTSSSGPSLLQKIGKRVKANYLFELTGPNTSSLNGNMDGSGTNINIVHYPAIGYRIGSKWSVTLTQSFTQKIDDVDNKTADPFFANDPYITFANSRILGSDKYHTNLYGFVRYYAPLSKNTINNRNMAKPNEIGNGRVRIFLDPSIAFLDGDLSFDLTHNLYLRFNNASDAERLAANGSPTRNDMDYLPDFYVNYQATKTIQPFLEVAAYLHHTSDGKWTHFTDESDGLALTTGANINVGKKVLLIPQASFPHNIQGFAKVGLALQAIYTFL
jgi:hypothetical protein